MYLNINNHNYTLRCRTVLPNSVMYVGLDADPRPIDGAITMYRDDGFELSADSASDYARQEFSGKILTLTNEPEPVTPEPQEAEPEYIEDERGNRYEQYIEGGAIRLKLVESYDGTTNY